jgi:multidrug resistance efflux pump
MALTLAAGCTSANEIVTVGTVDAAVTKVSLPSLASPQVLADIPLYSSDSQTPGAALSANGNADGGSSSVQASAPQSSAFSVMSVEVGIGDFVAQGDLLLTMDDTALQAAKESRKAEAAVAAAGPAVVESQLQEVKGKYADVSDGRAKIRKAQKKLDKAKKEANTQTKVVNNTQTQLKAQQKQLEQLLAFLPSGIERAKAEAGLKQVKAGQVKLTAAAKKLKAGLAKIKKGESEAKSGLTKLEKAEKELDDAVATLNSLKELTKVSAEVAQVPVAVADFQLSQTRIAAPVSGQIIEVATAGQVLAPEAAVALIRAEAPVKIHSWIAPENRSQLCSGTAVAIETDWPGEPIAGSISFVGQEAVYPPSSYPTTTVALTRAFGFTVETTTALPRGTPVTLHITPCEND